MKILLDINIQSGMVLENYSVTSDRAGGTFIHNTLDAERGDPTDVLHIHAEALRPIGEVLTARADALGVPPCPVLIRPPTPDPLRTIAATLEARAKADDPLSRSEMLALAVTLRSIQRREVETAPTPACAVVPMVGRLVPGSPVSREIG